MRAKRTDSNQASIVKDLRELGFQVVVTNLGDDYPDLMVGSKGTWTLIEIKKPDGDFTRGQLEFLADARGPIGYATDTGEAIGLIYGDHLTLGQRIHISQWLIKNPDQQSLSVKKLRKLVNA